MAELYLDKNDPLRKAERSQGRREQSRGEPDVEEQRQRSQQVQPQQDLAQCAAKPVPGRVAIPAHIRHAVNLRDQGQCTHKDSTGKRCHHTRWIDVHHIIAREFGGADTLENLTTLCSTHHRFVHRQQWGPQHSKDASKWLMRDTERPYLLKFAETIQTPNSHFILHKFT